MILQDDFRRLVIEQLTEQKMSRSELARRIGKPPQYVTDYLNGRNSAGPEMMELFFSGLGFRPRIVLEKIKPTEKRRPAAASA